MGYLGHRLPGPQRMAGMVSLWGASSLVKSIQTGNVTIASASLTGTATIAAVDTASTILFFGGNISGDGTNAQIDGYQTGALTLTNATTITYTRGVNDGVAPIVANYSVVEFLPGVLRSVQSGSIALTNGVTVNTATITSVNTAKAWAFYQNKTSNQGPAALGNSHWSTVILTNATTVTANRNGNLNLETPYYTVVEFF